MLCVIPAGQKSAQHLSQREGVVSNVLMGKPVELVVVYVPKFREVLQRPPRDRARVTRHFDHPKLVISSHSSNGARARGSLSLLPMA